MVHSSMSPNPLAQTPSATPTNQTPCPLPKSGYFQPLDSKPVAHSSQKRGGIPLTVPFRNSTFPIVVPTQRAQLTPIATPSKIYVACGAPAQPLTNDTPTNFRFSRLGILVVERISTKREHSETKRKAEDPLFSRVHTCSIHRRFTTRSQTSRDHLRTASIGS
jgi:hypothetical protein